MVLAIAPFRLPAGCCSGDPGKKVTLGGEVFYHAPEGPAAPQTRPATLIDIGGYYKFRDPGFQLLFCYGHAAVGQTENYAYLGL
jgi:hypothetical protein